MKITRTSHRNKRLRKAPKSKWNDRLDRQRRRDARRKTLKQPKRAKLPSLRSLLRRLDQVFSIYIRTRGAVNGVARCVTCSWSGPVANCHAGHFIKRQHTSTRYDERNVHPQCVSCNLYKSGNLIEYYEFMLKAYGPEVIAELRALQRTPKRLRRPEVMELLARFGG